MASLEGPAGNLPLVLTHSHRRSSKWVSEEIAREQVAAAVPKKREGKGGDEGRQEQQGERLTSSTNGCHILFLPLLQPAELRKGSASEVKRTKQPTHERK